MSKYSLFAALFYKGGNMDHEHVKANLNLYAVLKNLEDLCEFDKEMKQLTAQWDISIQFTVRKGPRAWVRFRDGTCQVSKGKIKNPSIILYFMSPAHLNRMFDGNGNPIPLKGFTRLQFLAREFSRLTDRLSYYLKPEDGPVKDKEYFQMNTRLTLNTAAFAVPEIAEGDSLGALIASKIPDGTVEMKILPRFHAVNITFNNGKASAAKGSGENVMALMEMKNLSVAGDFLNGRSDPFTAIASGDVAIRGVVPMLDSMSMLLDRVQNYLS